MVNSYPAITPHQEILEIMDSCFQEEVDGDFNARNRARENLKKFLFQTGDGTFTLPSQTVDGRSEYMHSIHGAWKESVEKFVVPAGLDDFKEVKILDLCSGMGYNAAAALGYLQKDDTPLTIDMVEFSPQTIATSLIIPPPTESHALVRRAVEQHLVKKGYLALNLENEEIPSHINIIIHLNDARAIMDELEGPYQAVFLDPFSPSKSPELYSLEFFQKLKRLMSADGRLLTYTNAAPARSSLLGAGFQVGSGPTVDGKTGTMASHKRDRIIQDLSCDDERMIALSDSGVPFRDPELDLNPVKIADNRRKERELVRGNSKFASTVRTPIYLHKKIENPSLRRRVGKHMFKLGLDGSESHEARYLVCPQFENCICNCGQGRFKGSRNRIKEMERRLEEFSN